MRSIRPILLVGAWLLMIVPTGAEAQGVTFGPHALYDLDYDAYGVGAQTHLGVDFGEFSLLLNPHAEYYFLEDAPGFDQSLFQAGVDAIYQFGRDPQFIAPFVGAGVAFGFYSADYAEDYTGVRPGESGTRPSLSLISGLIANPQGSIRPIVQATFNLGQQSRVGLKAGVLFTGH